MAKLSIKHTKEVFGILETYSGNNPYIKMIKNDVIITKKRVANDFELGYVLKNHDFKAIKVDKIVKVVDWFAEKKKTDWNLNFVPKKLEIKYLLGSTDSAFHVYCNYKQHQEKPVMCFIPKSCLLDSLEDDKAYEKMEVDFTWFNEILSKEGRKVKPHQETGVKFLLYNHKAILADQPGLGKTYEAIMASIIGNYKKILLITPASLKSNWFKELRTFLSEDDIGVINGDDWVDKKYTIINFDIFDRYYDVPYEIINGKKKKSRKKSVVDEALKNSKIFLANFDLIIIDEVHKLSKTSSNRYDLIYDYIKKSKINNIWLLSGTFMSSKPINLLSILQLIDHPITHNWEEFIKRYCDGKQITPKKTGKPIWLTGGSSNLDELFEKIKTCYIRRLKKDIPGMVERYVIPVKYELTQEERIEYNKLWDEYEEAQRDLGKTEFNKQLTEGTILRMGLSKFMLQRTIDKVDELLKSGEKIMIGCTYNDEISYFQKYYGKTCVIYNGSMTSKQKDVAEKAFMEDESVKVLCGNILSAGVGLNLVIASKIVTNSFSWLSIELEQLIDRLHRQTQTVDVEAYIQMFSNTILEDMWETVLKKEININTVIKGENEK